MTAFLTGSRAYGDPGPDSDVDLVVRVDKETAEKLRKLSDNGEYPIRFGKLNLVLCASDQAFGAWRYGTDKLIHAREVEGEPVDRETARGVLVQARRDVGVMKGHDPFAENQEATDENPSEFF